MKELDYAKIGKQFVNYLIVKDRVQEKLWPSDEPFVSIFKDKEDGTGKEIDWTKTTKFKDEPAWKQQLITIEDSLEQHCMDFSITPEQGNEINRIAAKEKITDEELKLLALQDEEIESREYTGYLDKYPISLTKDYEG